VESHYWWKGKKETAREVMLFIKTKKSAFKKLERFIRKHHAYDVPEILALPVQAGNAKYLAWLKKEIKA